MDQVKDQLEAVKTGRGRSLRLAQERVGQWKEAQRQKKLQLTKKSHQIRLDLPILLETGGNNELKTRDELIQELQKEVTEVRDQLEAVDTSRRRSLSFARERVEQWKKAQRQKQLQLAEKACQITPDQSMLLETEGDNELKARDERIRALQKTMDQVKDQLEAVETSRKRSLHLAQERLEQWKKAQQQKQLQLAEKACHIPLDQPILLETEGEIQLTAGDERIRALQKEITEVNDQLQAVETSRRRSLGLARKRVAQWKKAQKQKQFQLAEKASQIPLDQPILLETEDEIQLKAGDEHIQALQKAMDQVKDQLEAVETGWRRSLGLARGRLEQWKKAQRQKSCQIPLDQPILLQTEGEMQLHARDERIRALQKEVAEAKDQLQAVETSRRRSLGLARKRVAQWKKAQKQKQFQLAEKASQIPLDQPILLETEDEIQLKAGDEHIQALQKAMDQVKDQLEAVETGWRRSLGLARGRLEQWKKAQRQKSCQIPLDQPILLQTEGEMQLHARDERIRALQKEVAEAKDQLQAVETSRRRSLGLARERLEQWKKAQQQKERLGHRYYWTYQYI
uniref:Uncharacterized protein n=1 Tax=Knipowitschia caucasica TaxID=637954 RepID=A0AAV2JEB7_KNICA